MKKKKGKKKTKAGHFQEAVTKLEKMLGLGGKKTDSFIEKLSGNLGPLLNNLEATVLTTQSIPFPLLKKMFKSYLKEVAGDAGVSFKDLQASGGDLMELLKDWFKPELFQELITQLAQFYFLNRNIEGEVDEFGMDASFVEAVRPLFQFLYQDYWRVKVSGIENIPSKGGCLMVANHSGALPYDGAMLTVATLNEHPAHRNPRFLIEDFVYHFPFLGTFMHRIGAVRACPENAAWLLKKKQLVLVFPEGVKGLGKLYSERYQLKRFGRGGFIKLAIQHKVPIVPVAIIGAEEIHPIIWKSSILAKAMGVPYLPVTPTFPWLGPLGLIPLPSKWRIEIGKPISFAKYKPSQANDDLLVQKLAEEVRTEIQKKINLGLKKRKSVWLG
ncbi:MAG: lysophospholipid acyltransferase family protein [Deltaproteobacteria bacterium]|nr:lysophospholipid acyltransferase family protein [Deltaproteobacteria bacterium]